MVHANGVVQVNDANLSYETKGEGRPLMLLTLLLCCPVCLCILDKDRRFLHPAPETGSGNWGVGAATGNVGCNYPGRGYTGHAYAGAQEARSGESARKRRTRTISF